MRIVIAGAGRAGLSVAAYLSELGHEVTIIDRDPTQAKRAFDKHGLVAHVGDATDADLLRDARIGQADVVVAMLRRDAENLAVALLARSSGASRVMVRMRDPAYRAVYETAGVHRILSEIDVFIGALATAIEHEAVRHAMLLGSGSVAFELQIPASSKVAGRTVSDIAQDPGFPASCVFAGLSSESGRVQAPRGSSVVEGGCNVLLVAPRSDLAAVVKFFLAAAAS
jgi:trk system potassium uptake protein TrkA